MKLKQRARLKLAKMLNLKFESVETETTKLLYDGELEVGTEVFVYDEDGELSIPADGEYKYDDVILVIEGGLVIEIKVSEQEVEEPEQETETTEEFEEDDTLTERVATLEEQVKGLVEIIKEITGVVDEVQEEVEEIEEEFKKSVGKPTATALGKVSKKQTLTKSVEDRFFSQK